MALNSARDVGGKKAGIPQGAGASGGGGVKRIGKRPPHRTPPMMTGVQINSTGTTLKVKLIHRSCHVLDTRSQHETTKNSPFHCQ